MLSDHQLVRTRVRIKLKRGQTNNTNQKKYDFAKIQQPATKAQFTLKLKNRFDALQDYEDLEENVEEEWHGFEKEFNGTAKEVIGLKTRTETLDQQEIMGSCRGKKATEGQCRAGKI